MSDVISNAAKIIDYQDDNRMYKNSMATIADDMIKQKLDENILKRLYGSGIEYIEFVKP